MESLRRQAYREKMRELGKVLRHKITIQKKTTYIDEWGNQVRSWVDWKTVWAERRNLWGQAYYVAKAHGEENKVIFEVRYTPAYEELIHAVDQFQVVYKGIEYEIKHVDALEDGGAWIRLECLEWPPGEVSAHGGHQS